MTPTPEAIRRKRSKPPTSPAEWQQRPIRRCLSSHHCALCEREIRYGERYHDAGYRSRAHVACVNQTLKVPVTR